MYRDIPTTFDEYGIYYLDFQPKQSIYQRYLGKEISKKEFSDFKKQYNIDTAKLSGVFVKQRLSVFAGIKNGFKTVIVDTDNDCRFRNERKLEYSITNEASYNLDSVKSTQVSYEYFYDNKTHLRDVYLKILPFSKSHRGFSALQVYVSQDQHQAGFFEVDGEKYEISLTEPVFLGGNYDNVLLFLRKSNEKWIQFDPFLMVGDTFQLERVKFTIKHISEFGETLDLIAIQTSNITKGYRPGNRVPLEGITDINGQELNFKKLLQKKSTKFLLLDFWGTWCKPCIAELPSLKQIAKDFPDIVSVVSVAYDIDKSKVEQFVLDDKMTWDHAFVDRNESDQSIVNVLLVICYPTYILVDEDLKIVHRSCGKGIIELRQNLENFRR